MLNRRLNAARNVAAQLGDAEDKIDQALASSAELMAAMLRGRIEANLAAPVGQAALERVLSSINELGSARAEIVAAHAELDETKCQIGLREHAVGTGGGKSEFSEQGSLRVVSRHTAA